jgi:16S rRNA (adenine1518-N6/adenine1519-N6)-dimethyltransferase
LSSKAGPIHQCSNVFYTWDLPRKLGQHFLTSETVLAQIAAAAARTQPHCIVEIGPGRGALTRHLLPLCEQLHVIELDVRLADSLTRKFGNQPHLHIHRGDVLDSNLAEWGPAVIAGNLPYYITSPIVEKFLQLDSAFPAAVFLMQLEVAQRLLAKPNSRDYGYLTVATQIVCQVELVCKVPASAFSPPPKVESAAVRLTRRLETTPDLPALLEFVGRCFKHKRKTLRNNLRPFYGPVVDGLPEAGLRAEQLQLMQFADLRARLTLNRRE